jgi:hypothetical protein
MADSLNKMFVDVPNGKATAFNTTDNLTKYADQIAFLHGAGTIATKGEVFTGGTNEAIIVAGGPLADESSDNWPQTAEWWDSGEPGKGNRQIPANVSLQDILTQLFLKEEKGSLGNPSTSWSPSLSAPTLTVKKGSDTIASGKDYPFGTQFNVTYAKNTKVNGLTQTVEVTSTRGYFNGDSTTWISGNYSEQKTATYNTDSVTASATWGTDAINSGDTITIIPADSKTVNLSKTVTVSNGKATFTPTSFTSVTLWPSYNTKRKMDEGSKSISGTQGLSAVEKSSQSTWTVNGYAPIFSGQLTQTAKNKDSWAIAEMTGESSDKNVPTSFIIETGTGTTFVAIPEGNGNYDKTASWNSAKTGDSLGTVQTKVLPYTHPNTTLTQNYKIFFVTAAATWGTPEEYVLSFK